MEQLPELNKCSNFTNQNIKLKKIMKYKNIENICKQQLDLKLLEKQLHTVKINRKL